MGDDISVEFKSLYKKEDDGKTDELVEMIDRLMADGTGSLVIDIDETGEGIKVSTAKSNDCTGKQSACMQPNEKIYDEDE